jgi:hypothetical protein
VPFAGVGKSHSTASPVAFVVMALHKGYWEEPDAENPPRLRLSLRISFVVIVALAIGLPLASCTCTATRLVGSTRSSVMFWLSASGVLVAEEIL